MQIIRNPIQMILPVGFIYDFMVSYKGNNLPLKYCLSWLFFLIILPQANK